MKDRWENSPEGRDFSENIRYFSSKLAVLFTFSALRTLSQDEQRQIIDRAEYDRHPLAKSYVTRALDQSKSIQETGHDLRINSLQASIDLVPRVLPKQDQATALRRLHYQLGHMYERKATFELKGLSADDPDRIQTFALAATHYIQAEEAVGNVLTDYSLRTAECLSALGLRPFALQLGNMILGGNTTIIGPEDPGGLAMVEDLKRRASRHERSGGDVYYLSNSDLPDGSNN